MHSFFVLGHNYKGRAEDKKLYDENELSDDKIYYDRF
jgi:hypothetical protein